MSFNAADDELRALLAQSGARLDPTALQSLLEGVAAAPPGPEAELWMDMVAADPDPRLRGRLRTLLAEARSDRLASRETPADRLAKLRQLLKAHGLAGFVVPRADAHQGEQVPAAAERLAWISGFTGSAGCAVVLRECAALFVDGRYTVQAHGQVDPGAWEIRHIIDEPLTDWVASRLPVRGRLGYDPWVHTPRQVARLEDACHAAGGRVVAVEDNLVDLAWTDQPPAPVAPMTAYPEDLAGRSSADKRDEVAVALAKAGDAAAVIAAPDAIAWLLNIRGGDVPFVPVTLAFAIIHADGSVALFVDPRKVTPPVREHLGSGVRIAPIEALGAALDALGAERRRVRIDPDRTPAWIAGRLRSAGAVVADGADPCTLPKAIKNSAELNGIRAAHRRDGVALARFLAWLDGAAGDGHVSETMAADRLEAFRSEQKGFRGLSFATISAAGPHGAIVHYRVTPATDRPLTPGTLYLVDSGAQYVDGTTDVTRTVAIGEPTAEMRDRFSRVLQGHIAIATARFPEGTTGPHLDTLARTALWRAGLDYDHGTGHGVGAYLNVHEGPQRISKLPTRIPLQPGMVVSNEPGYYKTDAYGIRVENLVVVVPVPAPVGAERSLLGFETLTLAPIDRRLIEIALMRPEEVAWVDDYHARVREVLTPELDAETAAWLARATRPLTT
jgi:Xaa-Pro aminopeptidase